MNKRTNNNNRQSLSELNRRYEALVKEESELQGELKQINSRMEDLGVKNPADLEFIIEEKQEQVGKKEAQLEDIKKDIQEALNAIDDELEGQV